MSGTVLTVLLPSIGTLSVFAVVRTSLANDESMRSIV